MKEVIGNENVKALRGFYVWAISMNVEVIMLDTGLWNQVPKLVSGGKR